MKKGDKVLITWENLDGPEGIGRGMARCDVVMVRKASRTNPFIDVRIRDPKGRLWWTPPSTLTPYKVSSKLQRQRPRGRKKTKAKPRNHKPR